jgi:hypothetical protein
MEIHRDIGRHDAEIETLQKEIAELRQEIKQISKILNEARGGWRTMMLLGGAAGAVGAAFAKLAQFH